jgi:hypothetical protein
MVEQEKAQEAALQSGKAAAEGSENTPRDEAPETAEPTMNEMAAT